MKQDIIPTSPKVLGLKQKESASAFLVILLSIFFGSLAGAFTFFLLRSDKIWDRAETLVIRETSKDQQRDLVEKLLERVKGVIVYEKDVSSLILTSDGWLVSDASFQTSIEYKKQMYSVERTFFDATTGLTFYKIKASDLLPVQFSDPQERELGLSAVFVRPGWNIQISYIDEKNHFHEAPASSFGFNWSGELIGMVKSNGGVVLSEDIALVLKELLTEESASSPSRHLFSL